MRTNLIILSLIVVFLNTSAGAAPSDQKLELPETPYSYADERLPAHFPGWRAENTPRANPITDRGATLGRVLFYDRRLSANGKLSCASCHRQERAFADPRRVSRGVGGRRGKRNAQGLANLRYHPTGRFFWDERAPTLEAQVLMPIEDPNEMAADLDEVLVDLRADPVYRRLFEDAFGSSAVTRDAMGRALAQFVRSLVSYRSKFDRGMAEVDSIHEPFPNFSNLENDGKNLFLGRDDTVRGNCASCHLLPDRRGRRRGRGRGFAGGRFEGKLAIFMGPRPQNNGLDRTTKTRDNGVGDRTGEEEDMGLFKSPSLRNVELTAPYMHDGRLKTLEAVVDHYSRRVRAHPNLSGRLAGRGRRGGTRQMNLTTHQRRALVAFLKTLTDHEFIADVRFSDPFRKVRGR